MWKKSKIGSGLANYLNACLHQLQINQLIVIQLNSGIRFQSTIVPGKKN